MAKNKISKTCESILLNFNERINRRSLCWTVNRIRIMSPVQKRTRLMNSLSSEYIQYCKLSGVERMELIHFIESIDLHILPYFLSADWDEIIFLLKHQEKTLSAYEKLNAA